MYYLWRSIRELVLSLLCLSNQTFFDCILDASH